MWTPLHRLLQTNSSFEIFLGLSNMFCVLHRITHVAHVTRPVMNVEVRDPTAAPRALFYSASQRMGGVFLAVEKTHAWIPQDLLCNAASATHWMVQALNAFILHWKKKTFTVKPFSLRNRYFINNHNEVTSNTKSRMTSILLKCTPIIFVFTKMYITFSVVMTACH